MVFEIQLALNTSQGLQCQLVILESQTYAQNNIRDTIDLICLFQIRIKSAKHFFLRCHNFTQQKKSLFNNLFNIDKDILKLLMSS